MNGTEYERFERLAKLASEEQDSEKYHAMVDELNTILQKVLQENGASAIGS